eukprot:GILI01011445.1.p1 GENE.GILI01011445.1~~GILI01011445.1.p1  ORF type:complete len:310 (+),score=72.72 GILI01011445.1:62-991(+)
MSNKATVLPIGPDAIIIAGVTVAFVIVLIKKIWRAKVVPTRYIALDATKKTPFKLVEKKIISHDTRIFRFALPSEQHILGLPVGKHVLVSAPLGENGAPVSRAYTPVSSDDDVGHVDLLVKVYFKDVHPKFPQGGLLTQYLESLKIGDHIDFKGPLGRLNYQGRGNFEIKESSGIRHAHVTHVGMIAGGSGITPMYQVMNAIFKDKNDPTQISLIFGNQTEGDILLKPELDAASSAHADKFSLCYTLDRPSDSWTGARGFVNADMIKAVLPPPGPTTIILLCGPPPMVKLACIPALQSLGYDESLIFSF